MKLPAKVRAFFQQTGAQGGKASGPRKRSRTTEQYREMARKRWEKKPATKP